MNGLRRNGFAHALESAAAWLLGLLWILPLAYALWTAFHPPAFQASTKFCSVSGAPSSKRVENAGGWKAVHSA